MPNPAVWGGTEMFAAANRPRSALCDSTVGHQTVSEYNKRERAESGQPIEPADRRKKANDQQKRVRKTKLNRERLDGALSSEE